MALNLMIVKRFETISESLTHPEYWLIIIRIVNLNDERYSSGKLIISITFIVCFYSQLKTKQKTNCRKNTC